jgi:alpha-tubulin suppressor-like RCC1 family protein
VTPGTASVQVGGTTTLTATPRDANNAALTGRTIAWSTSAAAVATVANGVVTAVSAGSAVITATSEGKSGTATITVTSPPPAAVATVIVTPGTASVQAGGTTTLTAETRAANNAVLTGRVITWSTSSSAIATVANGVVTAVSAGTATITATSEGQNGTATVTVTAPPPPAFSGLMANAFTGCVEKNGVRYCWGLAVNGAFGNGSGTDLLAPTPVAHTPALATVASGYLHTCGLTAAGAAWCWGNGNLGALGNNSALGVEVTPVAVSGGRTFVALGLSLHDQRSCGIESNGDVWCWGSNFSGSLGDGTTTERLVPTKVNGLPPSKQVVGGLQFGCALTNAGAAWCWGLNDWGQLGDGTTTNRSLPVLVSGGHTFVDITAGFNFACGVRVDGVVLCWGNNGAGQLGDGTMQARQVPTAITTPPMVKVRARSATTCALTSAGAAWCWGLNAQGNLGDGTTTSRSTPVVVAGGQVFTDLALGNSHACATTSSQLYCWGNNAQGQLGLGPGAPNQRSVPTLVPGIP